MTESKKITVYADGACSGNPGPGGWGVVLLYNGHQKELSGYQTETTNNQMELMGAIKGLEALKEPCDVTLYTDSKYVSQGMSEWIHNWQKNHWRGSNKKPVKNVELWKRLLELTQKHNVTFKWVKGHSDNPYNNRCDELAVGEIEQKRCYDVL